jgi:hypothetical protein
VRREGVGGGALRVCYYLLLLRHIMALHGIPTESVGRSIFLFRLGEGLNYFCFFGLWH